MKQAPSFKNLSAEELDQCAWHAVSSWHRHVDDEIKYKNLDFSILIQSFISSTVARAIRKEADPLKFEDEIRLEALETEGKEIQPTHKRYFLKLKNSGFKLIQYAVSYPKFLIQYARFFISKISGKPVLFLPQKYLKDAPVADVVKKILDTRKVIIVDAAFCIPEKKLFQMEIHSLNKSEKDFLLKLYAAVLKGLEVLGVRLFEEDKDHLKQSITKQLHYIRVCEQELGLIRPAAILNHAHRPHPGIEFSHLGLRDHIPVIVFPHGLDCLRVYLDHIYAPYAGVWGKTRKDQFRSISNYQPKRIEVCGIPHLDRLRLPDKMNTEGEYWLWVERPHLAKRCQKPSHSPMEGIEILKVLLKELEQQPSASLVIKPHQSGEFFKSFKKQIDASPAASRVRIDCKSSLHFLLCSAKLVITEDSTGGMDAMFHGRTLIFAHFAGVKPSLPFVEYKAALPAFSPAQLHESMRKALSLTAPEIQQMLEGQRSFLKDHAGPCDGKAAERSAEFILSVLFKTVKPEI